MISIVLLSLKDMDVDIRLPPEYGTVEKVLKAVNVMRKIRFHSEKVTECFLGMRCKEDVQDGSTEDAFDALVARLKLNISQMAGLVALWTPTLFADNLKEMINREQDPVAWNGEQQLLKLMPKIASTASNVVKMLGAQHRRVHYINRYEEEGDHLAEIWELHKDSSRSIEEIIGGAKEAVRGRRKESRSCQTDCWSELPVACETCSAE